MMNKMKIRGKILIVHPDFHKKIKVESASHGLNIVKYTECLAKQVKEEVESFDKPETKRRRGFDFKF